MTETNEATAGYSPAFHILYEDNHIIVVLKKQMTACCPDDSKDDNLLDQVKEYLKIAYAKPGNVYVGLVHRLDRPTGGVMVYAKTSKAAARLTAGLQSGDFEKKYLAVLCGTPTPERGTLKNYLRKNTVNNMVYVCTPSEEGKVSVNTRWWKFVYTRVERIKSVYRRQALLTPYSGICVTAERLRKKGSLRFGRIAFPSHTRSPKNGCVLLRIHPKRKRLGKRLICQKQLKLSKKP